MLDAILRRILPDAGRSDDPDRRRCGVLAREPGRRPVIGVDRSHVL